jgi:hypothetical protein
MYKYTIEQFISFSNLIRYNIQWIEPSKEKIDLILKQIEKQNKF